MAWCTEASVRSRGKGILDAVRPGTADPSVVSADVDNAIDEAEEMLISLFAIPLSQSVTPPDPIPELCAKLAAASLMDYYYGRVGVGGLSPSVWQGMREQVLKFVERFNSGEATLDDGTAAELVGYSDVEDTIMDPDAFDFPGDP